MLALSFTLSESCYFDGSGALDCGAEQLFGAFGGGGLLAVVMAAMIFGVFYLAGDGDTATPTVALILSGAALVQMLPDNYAQFAGYLVVIGLAAAMFQVLQKYVLSPSTQ
jgi:hypothetical protein